MHQRAYVKGGFNWSLPPPKGQAAKGSSGSPCCDRLSNPLFFLILILSAFLGISAGVLALSEYWALEMQPGGSLGCLPCGTLGELAEGKVDGVPKSWDFLKERTALLVVDQLSLAGAVGLLVELASLLIKADAKVIWMTITKPTPGKQRSVHESVEAKLFNFKIQVVGPDSPEATSATSSADLVVLGTVFAGKWLDKVPKEQLPAVLKKTLWWIHEDASKFLKKTLLRHLPSVSALVVDSQAAFEAWREGVTNTLSLEMPPTHVVPLGLSRETSQAADTPVARSLLRRYVRDSLDVREDAVVVALLGACPGQDLFLRAFQQALGKCKASKAAICSRVLALVDGLDPATHAKLDADLRQFAKANGLLPAVRFLNQSPDLLPYLAASDAVVVNCQGAGFSSQRTLLSAMAFRLPLLVTARAENLDLVSNNTNGLVHSVGKEGVAQLASNLAHVILQEKSAQDLVKTGYNLVAASYLERHFLDRLEKVLKVVIDSKGRGVSSSKGKRKKRVKLVVEVVR